MNGRSCLTAPGNTLLACGESVRYPHMLPLDVEVWRDFVGSSSAAGWDWKYDVRVGSPPSAPAQWDENSRLAYRNLLLKRVDAVGRRGQESVVVEVKPVGNMSAIGQLLCYAHCLEEAHHLYVRPQKWLVCGVCDVDVLRVCHNCGIEVFARPFPMVE